MRVVLQNLSQLAKGSFTAELPPYTDPIKYVSPP